MQNNTEMQNCNQSEFARMNGWARSYVTELKKAGRLVMTEDGKVDIEASLIRIDETADPNRRDVKERHAEARSDPKAATQKKPNGQKKVAEDQERITFADGKAKEQHYRALQAELDYNKTIGELVGRAEMKSAVADMVMAFRQEAENLPHRISADLVGKDVNDIRAILKRSIHDMLANLQRGCDQRLNQQEQV